MTGEITLRGNILPIGGLKDKIIGAHRGGIKTIFIPKKNEKDIDDIPKEIQKDIKLILVDNYNEIYNEVFKK
jgi:ATP-dependent Lon protease